MNHTKKQGFQFRQFFVEQSRCAMKVGTDGVLLGAWAKGGDHILDIGTGTGVVALMMAQRYAGAIVDAIDVDQDAAYQATENVQHAPFSQRITVYRAALQNFRPARPYDSIVCNPPYFLDSLKAPDSSRSLARHASSDSMTFRDLFGFVKKHITAEGTLSVIVPVLSLDALETEAYLVGFRKTSQVLLKTTPRKPHSRVLVSFSKTLRGDVTQEQACLMNVDGSRSLWYQRLTEAFYIK